MLCPLPLNNYPYVGRLGLQGEVSVATQGAARTLLQTTTGYQPLLKNAAEDLSFFCILMTAFLQSTVTIIQSQGEQATFKISVTSQKTEVFC